MIDRMTHGAEGRLVVPKANSCRFVLPTSTAPACRSDTVTGASVEAGVSSGTRDPAVVTIPRWSMRSFSEIGMPCSGPRHSPRPISASAARAEASASSRVTVMKAFTWPFNR
jgi:hypothetical protein